MTNKKAKRYNEGKIDHTLHYIPALEAEARVWMHGAEKYGHTNWHALWGEETIDVVCASALRHLFAIMKGETLDPETGEPHAAHVRCNMAMLIKYYQDKVDILQERVEKEEEYRPIPRDIEGASGDCRIPRRETSLVPPGSYIKESSSGVDAQIALLKKEYIDKDSQK